MWISKKLCLKVKISGVQKRGFTVKVKTFIKDSKSFEKQERGSFDVMIHSNDRTVVVRWLDNKSVHLMSTYVAIEVV